MVADVVKYRQTDEGPPDLPYPAEHAERHSEEATRRGIHPRAFLVPFPPHQEPKSVVNSPGQRRSQPPQAYDRPSP